MSALGFLSFVISLRRKKEGMKVERESVNNENFKKDSTERRQEGQNVEKMKKKSNDGRKERRKI